MSFKYIAAISITTLCLSTASTAFAQIAEVRAGLSEFDERTVNINFSRKRANENSAALNFEILFEEPNFLKWALSPQPYIGGTLNLEGNTSYGGAGLLWRQNFGEKFYGDISFGLVAHTGTNDIPRGEVITFASLMTEEGRQSADAYLQSLRREIQFGSSVLFREQIAVGYNFSDDWSGELFLEHLSHGGLLDSNDNNGADILGFRAARKF